MPTVAKNIKEAIAETEKNKNNLTTAKTNIDNKLVSLGGQSAINLNDTPNKIEQMVTTQYEKMAIIQPSWRKKIKEINGRSQTIDFKIPFEYKYISFEFSSHHNYTNYFGGVSNFGRGTFFYVGLCRFRDIQIQQDKIIFEAYLTPSRDDDELVLEKIIAIG